MSFTNGIDVDLMAILRQLEHKHPDSCIPEAIELVNQICEEHQHVQNQLGDASKRLADYRRVVTLIERALAALRSGE